MRVLALVISECQCTYAVLDVHYVVFRHKKTKVLTNKLKPLFAAINSCEYMCFYILCFDIFFFALCFSVFMLYRTLGGRCLICYFDVEVYISKGRKCLLQ